MNATERSGVPGRVAHRAEIHDDLEQALAGAASAAHAELVCQGERAFVVAEHRGLEVPHAGRERPDAERLNECVATPRRCHPSATATATSATSNSASRTYSATPHRGTGAARTRSAPPTAPVVGGHHAIDLADRCRAGRGS